MRVVVWKIPKWVQSIVSSKLNAHIAMKQIDNGNKTVYLNLSDEQKQLDKWIDLIVEGNVLEIDMFATKTISPYGKSNLVKKASGERLRNPNEI